MIVPTEEVIIAWSLTLTLAVLPDEEPVSVTLSSKVPETVFNVSIFVLPSNASTTALDWVVSSFCKLLTSLPLCVTCIILLSFDIS